MDVVHNRPRVAACRQDLATLVADAPGIPSMELKDVVNWAIDFLDEAEPDAQINLVVEVTPNQAAQIELELNARHPILNFEVELHGSTLLILRGSPE